MLNHLTTTASAKLLSLIYSVQKAKVYSGLS